MIIINRNHISLQPEEQRISCQPGLSYRNLLKHVSLVIRPLRCYPFHDGVRTMTLEDYCLPPFRIRVWVRVRIRVGAIFLGGNCPWTHHDVIHQDNRNSFRIIIWKPIDKELLNLWHCMIYIGQKWYLLLRNYLSSFWMCFISVSLYLHKSSVLFFFTGTFLA